MIKKKRNQYNFLYNCIESNTSNVEMIEELEHANDLITYKK